MPYVSDNNLDEESDSQNPPQQAGQVSGQPNAVSGSTGSQSANQNQNSATQAPDAPTIATETGAPSGGPTGGKGGASSTYSAKAPTSSGQWTNLQSYLNANNGGEFGQQFAGNIGGKIDQANSDLSNAASNFEHEVDSGTSRNNQGVVDQVGTSPESMSQDDQNAFIRQLNSDYQGPVSTASDTGFQGAQSESQNAYQEGQSALTPEGQQSLLEKYNNTPTYSAGEKNLDTALLSSDPDAQAAIQQIASQASGLPVSYRNAATAAANKISNARAESAASQEAARSAIFGAGGSYASPTGGALGNIQNAISAKTANDAALFQKQQGDISAAIAKGDLSTLTPEEQAIVKGLNISNSLPANYGVSESPYLSNVDATGLNVSNEATQEQAAKLAALAQLAGQPQTFIDPTQAGTAPTSPVAFDNTGYQSAVKSAQAAYQNQVSGALNNIKTVVLTPSHGIYANNYDQPNAWNADYIQNQLATINTARAEYGLPPIANPAVTWAGKSVTPLDMQAFFNSIGAQ